MRASDQPELFLQAITTTLPTQKFVLGVMRSGANSPTVMAELRWIPTHGGFKWAIAGINYMNQKESGRYTSDPIEMAIWAIDEEKRHPPEAMWYLTRNIEHTVESEYYDLATLGVATEFE